MLTWIQKALNDVPVGFSVKLESSGLNERILGTVPPEVMELYHASICIVDEVERIKKEHHEVCGIVPDDACEEAREQVASLMNKYRILSACVSAELRELFGMKLDDDVQIRSDGAVRVEPEQNPIQELFEQLAKQGVKVTILGPKSAGEES